MIHRRCFFFFFLDKQSKKKKINKKKNVVIKIKTGRLSKGIYSKPKDSHEYLHYNSYHAEHIKISIIFQSNFDVKENFLRDKRSQVPCEGP